MWNYSGGLACRPRSARGAGSGACPPSWGFVAPTATMGPGSTLADHARPRARQARVLATFRIVNKRAPEINTRFEYYHYHTITQHRMAGRLVTNTRAGCG